MALSLENKVGKSKSLSHRMLSFLSRSLLSASLLAAGCSTTEVGRRYVGTTWEKSDKPSQEEVISTRREAGETRIKHRLGDLIVNYDGGLIGIPVSETPTRHVREIRHGRKAYVLREVKEVEVEYYGPKNKDLCGTSIAGASLFTSLTILAGYRDANNEDDPSTPDIDEGYDRPWVPIITSLFAAYCWWGVAYACPKRTRTTTEKEPTGREKPAEPEDYTTAGDFKAVPGETRPASSGSLSLSGFLQGKVPIAGNGHATISVPPLRNSLVFANNQNDAVSKVDLSWVRTTCREGLAEFVSFNAQPTTMQLAAQTHPPAGEEQRYETDQRIYQLGAYKIPSRNDMIQFAVERHINSRIQQATIIYKDMESHFPVHNVQASFSPVRVPTPADLASLCFTEQEDRNTAQRFISQYTYAPFNVRVNGEYSFMVLTPATFRVRTVHPNYRHNDGRMTFVPGNLEWEAFMVELGSKHRVREVPE